MRPIHRTALAMLALATLATAGCGGPASPGTAPASSAAGPRQTAPLPPRTTAPAPSSPTRTTQPDGLAWPTGARTTRGTAGLLVAVRAARHPGFDRVVFEFAEGLPPSSVKFVPHVLEDPRGGLLPLRGQAFLQVTFQHASAVDQRSSPPRRTYTGPTALTPNLPSLTELRLSGDFEAVLSFGVGLRQRAGFRVLTLPGPWRVVVDVSHQPAAASG
jgi:hypothetical protein